LTCTGAEPIAITDCLNFGNPERPDIMGQFVYAIEGMDEACRALDYPVVSGNVSLYNETNGVAIPPTPAIGGVGLIKDLNKFQTIEGAKEGDSLVMIGDMEGWLGASLYAQLILGFGKDGTPDHAPPPVDLEKEKKNGDYVRRLIRDRRVHAVHDLSDGGLKLGFKITNRSEVPNHAWLFGEDQGRYLLAVEENSVNPVISTAQNMGLTAVKVGSVGGDRLIADGGFDIALADAHMEYENWLPDFMAS